MLNCYAKDKYKLDHAVRELGHLIQSQSKVFNSELDKKRKSLRTFTIEREKAQDYDPEQESNLTSSEMEII